MIVGHDGSTITLPTKNQAVVEAIFDLDGDGYDEILVTDSFYEGDEKVIIDLRDASIHVISLCAP